MEVFEVCPGAPGIPRLHYVAKRLGKVSGALDPNERTYCSDGELLREAGEVMLRSLLAPAATSGKLPVTSGAYKGISVG